MATVNVAFPHQSVAVIDPQGRMTREGLRFWLELWLRTGGDAVDLTGYVTAATLATTLEDYPTETEQTAAIAAALLPYAKLAGGNSFTGAQTVAFQALADGATIDTDAGLSNHFSVTLAGNRTLANPSNMRDGGIYNWRIKQDGTGSRTLAYGSKFRFSGSSTLSTAAGAVDRIIGQYFAADDVIECALTRAYA